MKSSRRHFLGVSAGAAAAGVLSAATPSQAAQADATKLPPSIAALKSRKSEAVPISADEMRTRVERARQLMSQNGLQAIAVTNGSSLTYYSGAHWWVSERFFGMFLPAKGDPFFVCPAFEEDRAREQLAKGPFEKVDVRTWQENEIPTPACSRAWPISA